MTAKPRKMEQYIAEGARLTAAVNAYRAAKGEAGAEGTVTQQAERSGSNVTSPTPIKRKSYPLPPAERPTEIPGYPLNNPSPAQEVPEYTIGRVKAMRATQAARRGKRAPLTPNGSPGLRKRDSVRTWKVAE